MSLRRGQHHHADTWDTDEFTAAEAAEAAATAEERAEADRRTAEFNAEHGARIATWADQSKAYGVTVTGNPGFNSSGVAAPAFTITADAAVIAWIGVRAARHGAHPGPFVPADTVLIAPLFRLAAGVPVTATGTTLEVVVHGYAEALDATFTEMADSPPALAKLAPPAPATLNVLRKA